MNLSKNGNMPVAMVTGSTLAHATYEAWKACYKHGVRVANVKHGEDEPLAYDTSVLVEVQDPLGEPAIFTPGMPGDDESLETYRLEVVEGIHDSWVGHGWDYTYHERFAAQIPKMLDRIEQTWNEKGRITSRDFQLTTWQWETDTVIDDPPCLQIVHVRLLPIDKNGRYKLNLTVVFRSRDLGNAFWMNAWAFISFQKRLAELVEERLVKHGISVFVGTYTDFSISNHLYGKDEQKRHLVRTLERMEKEPWQNFSMNSGDFLPEERLKIIRHKIAAQLHYEKETRGTDIHSFSPPEAKMEEFGIDWRSFPYPKEWDL